MVVGILPTPSDIALCLDNLAEAGFAPGDISLVMRSKQDVEKLANVSGALNGLALDAALGKLTDMGLRRQDIAAYRNAVISGGAIVAVAVPVGSEDAAAEIITDSNGKDVRVLEEG